ncbi:putative nucleocapsid protein [Pilchard orthomyxovirus]|uniref:Nucleocapsid protein n=1 Tax=Pilchard orthomyxovirus TaxID=2732827 RepID=A0A6M4AKT0_9ORTO|nr:putative nucleocapsid protein [Pilchard orthomyxovirus]QJQ28581.1 putative nucleocapsid protein [Pilchard orthomyxovirus]QJQ28641.1 putative nucleocapsid protein [Pilchard orthomyxovirus]QJQ28651.1 putative nucleocapsid protein [Pilchard orthomyxovirus]QJQ28671.1 putative nucleocapsid protein [Pilchard orthomyxovirus]QJQ28691.1 putative nucleocapsid protein [Pilchard orthomyxovirus]
MPSPGPKFVLTENGFYVKTSTGALQKYSGTPRSLNNVPPEKWEQDLPLLSQPGSLAKIYDQLAPAFQDIFADLLEKHRLVNQGNGSDDNQAFYQERRNAQNQREQGVAAAPEGIDMETDELVAGGSGTTREGRPLVKRLRTRSESDNSPNDRKRNRRANLDRTHNFVVAARAILGIAVSHLKNEHGLKEFDAHIEQNLEAVLRVMMLADTDGKRKSRDGTVEDLKTARINIFKDGVVVQSKAIELDDLKKAIKAGMPAIDSYIKPSATSTMTAHSFYQSALALISLSMGASEKLFAPGKKYVTKLGFRPECTTLTDGSTTAARIASHNRWINGPAIEISSLIKIRNKGGTRTGTGEPILNVVKKNILARTQNAHQRMMIECLDNNTPLDVFTKACSQLMQTYLALPMRRTRAFLPPLSVLSQILLSSANDDNLLMADFFKDAHTAVQMMREVKARFVFDDKLTVENFYTIVLAKLLGTPFFSADLARLMCPKASLSRSDFKSLTTRLKIPTKTGAVASTYTVKELGTPIVRWETRQENPESSGGGGSWQANATGSFGHTAFNKKILEKAGGSVGPNFGSQSFDMRIFSTAYSNCIKEIQKKTGKLTVHMTSGGMETEHVLSAGGIFSNFVGTEVDQAEETLSPMMHMFATGSIYDH